MIDACKTCLHFPFLKFTPLDSGIKFGKQKSRFEGFSLTDCSVVTMESQPENSYLESVLISYENKNVAVLVSDLSGFTSTTRAWGITHMASIIIRKRQLCLPYLNARGAIFISTEADNFICIFTNPVEAVKAALEMQAVLADYKTFVTNQDQLGWCSHADLVKNDNRTSGAKLSKVHTPEQNKKAAKREHFLVKFNGVAVHYGNGVTVDKLGLLHGETFNRAYHMGEDCAEKGNVLVSGELIEILSQ